MELYLYLGILFVFVGFLIATYNKLITRKNGVVNAWANVGALLQKRFDLVPNLVESVKGYTDHEKELLERVTKARTSWADDKDVKGAEKAEGEIAEVLKSVMAVGENYPDLKASNNFLALQGELAGIEAKIAYARQRYNKNVMVYNITIQKFPVNLVAGMFGFQPEEFFEIEDSNIKEPVKVQF